MNTQEGPKDTLGGTVDNWEGPVDTQGVTNGHPERTDGHQEGLTDTLGGAVVNQEDTHEKQTLMKN